MTFKLVLRTLFVSISAFGLTLACSDSGEDHTPGTSAAGYVGTGGQAASGVIGGAGGLAGTGGAGTGGVGTGGVGTGGAGTGGAGTGGAGTGGSSTECPPPQLVGWAAVGDGMTTTGGGDATPQEVTSMSELKDLAGGDEPRVIHVRGTLDGGLDVGSNKTIVGIGKDARINGGITMGGVSNIIIRNLTIIGGNDTISSRGSHHMWLDHLAVADGSDGVIDLTRESDFATVSWCKVWYDRGGGHKLAFLFGGGSTHTADRGHNNHTVHHNWFSKEVKERMPRLLFGRGHIYNNFYNSPGNNYCVGSGSWSSLYVENNYFLEVSDPHRFQDGNPSYIEAVGNVYDNTNGKQDTGNGGSGSDPPGPWDPSSVYSYQADPAESIPDLVQRCAGPQ